MLDEACEVIKLLWSQELSNFEGKYYTLTEARHEPKPVQKPYPPFTIGGSGEKLTLRVVAKHADIWNAVSGSLEETKHKIEVLEAHCAEIGRDANEIRRSIQFYLASPDEISGVRQRIEPFLEIGVSHVCIGTPTQYYPDFVAQLAQEVAPLLK